MPYLKSSLLNSVPGIIHGFGTRDEPLPSPFQVHWEEMRPRWRQVHRADSIEVTSPGQDCGEVDALSSAVRGIPIAVMTADCVPILLARKDGRRVAAVHSGWRGTQARIIDSLWNRLRDEGEKPSDWVAAVGPSVGPCCYEVNEEIASAFESEFAGLGPKLAVPRFRHLNLVAINEALLRLIGLGGVDVVGSCTYCTKDDGSSAGEKVQPEKPMYFSYRREGSGTRQWSVAQLT